MVGLDPLNTPSIGHPLTGTIQMMPGGMSHGGLSTPFDGRLSYQIDPGYSSVFVDLDSQHHSSMAYSSDKYLAQRRKIKLQGAPGRKLSKSKKNVPEPDHNLDRIFIWDLDE